MGVMCSAQIGMSRAETPQSVQASTLEVFARVGLEEEIDALSDEVRH
jgi:hypothetical protein